VKAEANKKAADDAVVAKSVEKGCGSNRRQLLQAQVDAADTELRARQGARRAQEQGQKSPLGLLNLLPLLSQYDRSTVENGSASPSSTAARASPAR
jgi:hypothetical protein